MVQRMSANLKMSINTDRVIIMELIPISLMVLYSEVNSRMAYRMDKEPILGLMAQNMTGGSITIKNMAQEPMFGPMVHNMSGTGKLINDMDKELIPIRIVVLYTKVNLRNGIPHGQSNNYGT